MSPLPETHPDPDGSVRRILIVDDEPTLRFGFAYALTDEATVTDTASNGSEALELMEGASYDAVVLDLRMPEVDGLAVIERMRSRGDRTPVILCSAFINLHSVILAIRNQVVDFLMKPVKPMELRKALAGALGNDSTRLGKALSAVRRDDFEDAMGILGPFAPDMGESEKAWLQVLASLRENHSNVKEAASRLDDSLINNLVVQGEG